MEVKPLKRCMMVASLVLLAGGAGCGGCGTESTPEPTPTEQKQQAAPGATSRMFRTVGPGVRGLLDAGADDAGQP